MIQAERAEMSGRLAIVVGANGQDGTYLTEHLTSLGYLVIGIKHNEIVAPSGARPFSIFDRTAVMDLVRTEQPDGIYYLAAHHHSSQEKLESLRQLVDVSYDVHCSGLLNFLDSIVATSPKTRLLYAASSLIFGEPTTSPQNEATPYAPICAYGITKTAGMSLCRLYRREKHIFSCSAILFNHESPRRAPRFVTRRIVQAVRSIKAGRSFKLTLGDLDAQVDWSYAGDVVRAMQAMLQLESPQDFVVASGVLHTVRDFADRAFRAAQLDYHDHVVQASGMLQRKVRQYPLLGDSSRLKAATGWTPKVSFEDLVDMMVQAEMTAALSDA